jgi:hypothetical protein
MKKMDQLKNKKLKSELITAKREISSLKKTILKLKRKIGNDKTHNIRRSK